MKKQYFNELRKDVEKALKEVEEKYQISIHAGNVTYTDLSFSIKLDCTRTDIDVQKEKFLQDLPFMRNWKESDYMRKFVIKGTEYQLIGFKPENKYSMILERVKDKEKYKFVEKAILDLAA